MADENQVATPPNDTKTTPPTVAGSEKGSVPTEGDIIGVKKVHEKEVEGIRESHEKIVKDLNENVSTLTNTKTQLEARIQTLEESSASSEATSQELTQLKSQLDEANKTVETLTSEVTEEKRTRLVSLGVPAEKLEGQSLANLKLMEIAASSVSTPNNGNLAVGSGGGAGATQTSGLDKFHGIVKEAEKRSGIAPVSENEIKPPSK